MVPQRPQARAFWVTLVEAGILVAASAAVVITLGGRTRIAVDGLLVTLRSPINFVVFTAACGALRLWLGRTLPPLPAVPRPDFSFIEAERVRFAAPEDAGRDVWIYALLALLGSLVWIAPHVLHLRNVPDPGDPIKGGSAAISIQVSSFQFPAGSWKLGAGSWKLGAGNWELEAGSFF